MSLRTSASKRLTQAYERRDRRTEIVLAEGLVDLESVRAPAPVLAIGTHALDRLDAQRAGVPAAAGGAAFFWSQAKRGNQAAKRQRLRARQGLDDYAFKAGESPNAGFLLPLHLAWTAAVACGDAARANDALFAAVDRVAERWRCLALSSDDAWACDAFATVDDPRVGDVETIVEELWRMRTVRRRMAAMFYEILVQGDAHHLAASAAEATTIAYRDSAVADACLAGKDAPWLAPCNRLCDGPNPEILQRVLLPMARLGVPASWLREAYDPARHTALRLAALDADEVHVAAGTDLGEAAVVHIRCERLTNNFAQPRRRKRKQLHLPDTHARLDPIRVELGVQLLEAYPCRDVPRHGRCFEVPVDASALVPEARTAGVLRHAMAEVHGLEARLMAVGSTEVASASVAFARARRAACEAGAALRAVQPETAGMRANVQTAMAAFASGGDDRGAERERQRHERAEAVRDAEAQYEERWRAARCAFDSLRESLAGISSSE